MLVMIDAVVLIYALAVEAERITSSAKHWRKAVASHELVMEADAVAMSAISWYEVLRGMTPDQQGALMRTGIRVDVRAADSKVAVRAAELFLAARQSEDTCDRCMGVISKPLNCKACGNTRSRDQKWGDIVMVATADVDPDVRILYSWDGGVLTQLAQHANHVQIKEPPPAQGTQMQIQIPDTADISEARERKSRCPSSGAREQAVLDLANRVGRDIREHGQPLLRQTALPSEHSRPLAQREIGEPVVTSHARNVGRRRDTTPTPSQPVVRLQST